MANNNNDENTPIPDPTNRTRDDLRREISLLQGELDRRLTAFEHLRSSEREAERKLTEAGERRIGERLDAMDKATSLLSATVNRVPTEMQKEVSHMDSLTDERFNSVATQFKERDTRSERESRDNKLAVDAAFAAQEKQAAAQNKSNAEAIGKSETGTSETINKLAELFETNNKALSDKIDDLKLRLNSTDQRIGTVESLRQGSSQSIATIIALVTVAVLVLSLVLGGLVYLTRRPATTPTQVIVPPNTPTTLVR